MMWFLGFSFNKDEYLRYISRLRRRAPPPFWVATAAQYFMFCEQGIRSINPNEFKKALFVVLCYTRVLCNNHDTNTSKNASCLVLANLLNTNLITNNEKFKLKLALFQTNVVLRKIIIIFEFVPIHPTTKVRGLSWGFYRK